MEKKISMGITCDTNNWGTIKEIRRRVKYMEKDKWTSEKRGNFKGN